MVDEREQRLRIAAARADFLEYGSAGAAGVTETVAASWQRSQSAGVNSDNYQVEYHNDIDFDSRLVRCARPVIERLTVDMADVPVTIALTDACARIVDRRDCSNAVGTLLDRVDFLPGYSFEERGVGTNGIGTVFESGAPISVVGPEHFNDALVQFACTGAPILDPVTGKIEGVLDVSLLAESWSPLLHALVKSAALDIGRNLLLDRSQAQQALFEMYVKADSRPRQAVMAIGDAVIMNQRAQKLFTPDEQFTIHEHARFLMTRRDRILESIPLASGRTVQIRATRILCGEAVAGMILLLDSEAGAASHGTVWADEHALPIIDAPDPRTTVIATELRHPRPPIVESRCPAWENACDSIAAALGRRDNLLVIGESGTGKFTLVAELFHRLHPSGRSVAVDAEQVTRQGDLGAVDTTTSTLLIVRNIDRLSTYGVDVLNGFFDTLDLDAKGTIVAATLSDASLDSDLPFHDVLENFDHSVTVPAIRYRSVDLPQLVSRVLQEIAPDRRIRISPEAMRVIGAYSWPRNMTQLRDALHSALLKRPVGEIQADDLPGYCRSTSARVLNALEVSERDTIIKALRDCGGNRVHTAEKLGMARSSLYRKLKLYGVTEI
ncbi:transcriptional regulator [Rhodococcus opacus]|uniref:Transcriptional regulator n=1 Tax=Rhodococcus opacus TaxID=37919 RepID=A0A1B1KFD4_RHOOP|nr:helix-turn-helix domain-containing protein [Rhodococcus opacus]ANS31317.1 transcriptional regulator [Rhodococcus opacus]